MSNIFEVIDKTGRAIKLTKEQWSHIRKKHPEVEDIEQIIETLVNPDKIIINQDRTIQYFYAKDFGENLGL